MEDLRRIHRIHLNSRARLRFYVPPSPIRRNLLGDIARCKTGVIRFPLSTVRASGK